MIVPHRTVLMQHRSSTQTYFLHVFVPITAGTDAVTALTICTSHTRSHLTPFIACWSIAKGAT